MWTTFQFHPGSNSRSLKRGVRHIIVCFHNEWMEVIPNPNPNAMRLRLGKQSVNLCKWSNGLIPHYFLNKWRRRQTMGFWVVGSIPTIHNNKLFRFFPCRTWKILSLVSPGNETAWILTEVRRISGRPAIPPFQGGRVLWGFVWVSYRLTCASGQTDQYPTNSLALTHRKYTVAHNDVTGVKWLKNHNNVYQVALLKRSHIGQLNSG